jgi:hypothetical protein
MEGARDDRLVRDLAVEHRGRAAMRGLMAAGAAATPAVRRGLAHPDARVRVGCCDVLDHFLDRDAIPELVGVSRRRRAVRSRPRIARARV